jgi:hypothetical protein
MENGGMESVAEIEQQLEGVTQMHVAAVNGDKALLAKQIVCKSVFNTLFSPPPPSPPFWGRHHGRDRMVVRFTGAESVPICIATKVVGLNPAHGEVYST